MPVLGTSLRPARSDKRQGFSLIEILVVLALLGILAAILLPVFARVRDSSQTTTCASNLRQVGLAIALYTADHAGFYPSYLPPSRDCSWADRVFRYVKSADVLWCPSFEEGEYRVGCTPAEEANGQRIRFDGSYSINTLEDAIWEAGRTQPCVPERRVRFPSNTILVLDGTGTGYVNPGIHKAVATVAELEKLGIPDRHNGGANVLFADGHIKWRDLPSLVPRRQWRASGTD